MPGVGGVGSSRWEGAPPCKVNQGNQGNQGEIKGDQGNQGKSRGNQGESRGIR